LNIYGFRAQITAVYSLNKLHLNNAMRKSTIDRLYEFLQNVAVGTFMLTMALVFVVAGAVTLTFVWLYTRR
jgi:hypothetical protein